MKLQLLIPSYTDILKQQYSSTWEYEARRRLWSCPSLSLLTVAAMLPEDAELSYTDLNYPAKADSCPDWVLLSPSTAQANQAYAIADAYRAAGTQVCIGGPHATVLPDEALQHADTVFIGEAEETLPRFLEDMKTGQHRKIYQSTEFPDLSSSPAPAYELARKYPYKSIPLQTSRGCPHQCSFCLSSTIYGAKLRRKTAGQVENELAKIKQVFTKPYIFFTDDNLLISKNWNRELLSIMKNSRLSWYAFSDARIADDDRLLTSLRDAGCTQLLIGFESLHPENLESLNKNHWKMHRLHTYKETVKRIQSHGIGVVGSFVVGMDHDTPAVFDILYDFIMETSLYATNITVLTPFPGTKTYDIYRRENRLLTQDWSKYNGFELTFRPKNMTIAECSRGYAKLIDQLNSDKRINKITEYFKSVFKNTSEAQNAGTDLL